MIDAIIRLAPVLAGVGLIIYGFYVLIKGRVKLRHSGEHIDRREAPAIFWTVVSVIFVLGLTVAIVFWPPPPDTPVNTRPAPEAESTPRAT